MKILFTTKITLRLRSGQAPDAKGFRSGRVSNPPLRNLRALRAFVVRMNLRFLYAFSPWRQTMTSTSAAPLVLCQKIRRESSRTGIFCWRVSSSSVRTEWLYFAAMFVLFVLEAVSRREDFTF